MKVLITGGAGLVGSHTAEYYANKGVDVVAFDNLMRSKLFDSDKKTVEYSWNYLRKYKNITRVVGDVRSEEDVMKVIRGVDLVIHAAAQPGVPLSFKIPKEDFTINAYGTLNVLECLRKSSPDATFIYCSTDKIFAEAVDQHELEEKEKRYVYKGSIDETLPEGHIDPNTLYGVSKYVGDLYTQKYHQTFGMRTAVFRMGCIYGARQFGFEEQGWVAWFIIAAILNKPITIFGNGKQVRDLLYVNDVIEAYDTFFKSDLNHTVLNIGGGPSNTLSLLECIDFLQKQTKKELQISFAEWRPLDQKICISNITKIKEEFNWKPRVPVLEGLGKLAKWAEENKSLF